MPRNSKESNTATFDASCDIRDLAICALGYKNMGPAYMPKSRSGLVAAIIADYANVLINMKQSVRIESVGQAHEALIQMGFMNWHKAGRSRPQFLEMLAQEEENPDSVVDRSREIEAALRGELNVD